MKSNSSGPVVTRGFKWMLLLAAVLLLAVLVGLASIALVYLQSSNLFEEAGQAAVLPAQGRDYEN